MSFGPFFLRYKRTVPANEKFLYYNFLKLDPGFMHYYKGIIKRHCYHGWFMLAWNLGGMKLSQPYGQEVLFKTNGQEVLSNTIGQEVLSNTNGQEVLSK